MKQKDSASQIVTRLMFRLLPIQILLSLIGSVNGIVSSLFASNVIGSGAMGIVGLYGPVAMLLGSIGAMLFGGSQILCGKHMGRNELDKMQNVFSLDLAVSSLVALVFTAFLLLVSVFDLSGFLARDPAVRPLFNRYILGQTVGVLPTVLSTQLAGFLSLENKTRRTTIASIVCIIVNLVLNWLFVLILKMGIFGLSLAGSLSMWVFCVVEAQYFLSGKSDMRFSFRNIHWRESLEIVKIGLPGAIANGYQTIRGIIVNNLLTVFVSSAAVSAFATSNSLLGFFWAIPAGMLNVSRMMFSISVGEEDRETLIDAMRTAMRRYLPLMCAVSAFIIAMAVPFTRLYCRDVSDPVYEMTVWGFRILPLCMPLSVICMHFTCYAQVSGKTVFVHVLSALDGVLCVAGFSALLVPSLGINGVHLANVLNGVVTCLAVPVYACLKKKKFPRNLEELMVIPDDFGVGENDRISLSLHSMEEVIRISQTIQNFCLEKGIDARRAFLAGLCMEEMAGNVVSHGFTKDTKNHSVDVRVVYKENSLILRLKDDCIPFDPASRRKMTDPEDPAKNIGIRMVMSMAADVSYQSVLGLNVLTVNI